MEGKLDQIIIQARGGSTAAQIELGNGYLTGCDVAGHMLAVDFEESRKWLELAHDQGASTATFMLGVIYEEGKGVFIEIPTAVALYEKAAERGSFLACVHLARIYAHGKGIAPSADKASLWYEKSLSFQGEVDVDTALKEARDYLRR